MKILSFYSLRLLGATIRCISGFDSWGPRPLLTNNSKFWASKPVESWDLSFRIFSNILILQFLYFFSNFNNSVFLSWLLWRYWSTLRSSEVNIWPAVSWAAERAQWSAKYTWHFFNDDDAANLIRLKVDQCFYQLTDWKNLQSPTHRDISRHINRYAK